MYELLCHLASVQRRGREQFPIILQSVSPLDKPIEYPTVFQGKLSFLTILTAMALDLKTCELVWWEWTDANEATCPLLGDGIICVSSFLSQSDTLLLPLHTEIGARLWSQEVYQQPDVIVENPDGSPCGMIPRHMMLERGAHSNWAKNVTLEDEAVDMRGLPIVGTKSWNRNLARKGYIIEGCPSLLV